MRIAFVSSPIYPDLIRQLVEAEFDYFDVVYLTYQDSHTKSAAILAEHQSKVDAVLFSGYLAYDYCLKHCKQEVPWLLVKPSSSVLARTLREARQQGHDISTVTVDYYTKKEIESAYFENGFDDNSTTIYRCRPVALAYADTHTDDVYQFHYKNLTEFGATCCMTSNFYAYQKLREQGFDLVFVKNDFDTFRRAFYQLYLMITEKANENAQIVALVVDIASPGQYSVVGYDEFMEVKRRLRIVERVYAFAQRLRAIVVEVSNTQYLVIVTRNIFDHETQDFHEFDLFEQVSSDATSDICFGIGLGEAAIDAKKNAYIALERARASGRNTACMVAANSETISIVSYFKNKEESQTKIDEKITRLSARAGVSNRRMFQLCQAAELGKKTDFTSQELADFLSISKRNMDRIILKLEQASMADVIGHKFDNAVGRPSRVIRLNLEL